MEILMTSNLAEVGAKFLAGAVAMDPIIAATVGTAADRIRDEVVTIMKDRTPIAKKSSKDHEAGTLQKETMGEVVMSVEGTTVNIRQPSTTNWTGHGLYPYALFLIGGTKYITPRDYAQVAMDEAQPVIEAILAEKGVEMMTAVAAVLH